MKRTSMKRKSTREDWEVVKGSVAGTHVEAAGLGAVWWDRGEGPSALARGCCSFPVPALPSAHPHTPPWGLW